MVTQAKREQLQQQVITLSRLVAEVRHEQDQLEAERDQLGASVNLRSLQLAGPVDVRPQVIAHGIRYAEAL